MRQLDGRNNLRLSLDLTKDAHNAGSLRGQLLITYCNYGCLYTVNVADNPLCHNYVSGCIASQSCCDDGKFIANVADAESDTVGLFALFGSRN